MKQIKIGRGRTNDIVIDDFTVSSEHAKITITDTGQVFIKDLNSKNGTYVNGKPVIGEVSITATDLVKVANREIDWVKSLNEGKKAKPQLLGSDQSMIKRKKAIGRTAGNDIVFDFKDVSTSHAQLIEKVNGEVVIADSGSTNGTFVNGRKISVQVLYPGDKVLIANKYPLVWENIFKGVVVKTSKPQKTKQILISVAALAVIIISVFIYHKYMPWSPERIYATYKKSVVMIESAYYYQISIKGELVYFALDDEGNLKIVKSLDGAKFFAYTGTGFIVSRDGKILTNRHVVSPWEYDEAKQMISKIKEEVKKWLTNLSLQSSEAFQNIQPMISEVTVEGKLLESYMGIYLNDTHKSENSKIPCTVIKDSGSEDIDIGMIQINSHTLPNGVDAIVNLKEAITGDNSFIIGTPVYTLGYPGGEELAKTSQGIEANNLSGSITQLRGEYDFGHNIEIIPGASGSPVFNKYGRLIGVINAGFPNTPLKMAIKAKYAVDLAK